MKRLTMISLLLLVAVAFATPGDILRSQALTNQPAKGVRGLAMDWTTGNIWVAGSEVDNDVRFTEMNTSTMSVGTWLNASDMFRLFDIGYGYEDGGSTYLVMNDRNSPFTKLIDPTDGSHDGDLPDHYSSSDYTDGCSVDWDTNNVYLSSYGDEDVVYYNGSTHNTFATISGARNMGAAVGWGHVFILRTSTYYSIEVYLLDGTFVESIALNNWDASHNVMGLSCGQENEVGNNETLFFADYTTHQVHEIEVGDYTSGSNVEKATWGQIKAGFGTPLPNDVPSAINLGN